jgi:hypothetical protein
MLFSEEQKFVSKYFLSTDADERCSSSNLASEWYVSEKVVTGSEAHYVELDY